MLITHNLTLICLLHQFSLLWKHRSSQLGAKRLKIRHSTFTLQEGGLGLARSKPNIPVRVPKHPQHWGEWVKTSTKSFKTLSKITVILSISSSQALTGCVSDRGRVQHGTDQTRPHLTPPTPPHPLTPFDQSPCDSDAQASAAQGWLAGRKCHTSPENRRMGD